MNSGSMKRFHSVHPVVYTYTLSSREYRIPTMWGVQKGLYTVAHWHTQFIIPNMICIIFRPTRYVSTLTNYCVKQLVSR